LTHYDAVVVGAGPAGSTAAFFMASSGLKVVLLERGDYPGSKNMFGGTIYAEPLAEVVPEFWLEAPLERAVVRDGVWLLDRDSAVEIGFSGLRFAKAPFNKFTALRPRFDRWLAEKAVAAGAALETATVARELLYERKVLGRGAVCGVALDGGEKITAEVVVLAEGVQASLTRKAGLTEPLSADRVGLWVREVLSLPAEKIEDRFLLEKEEGAVLAMVGYPTGQSIGLAGIFTNRDSLSILLGMPLHLLMENRVSLPELLSSFKKHPLVRRLIAGGESMGYAAHLTTRGGVAARQKFYSDGVMVAGEAALMVSGRRGSDLAMLAGKLAAETAVQARARGDFSSRMLKNYKRKLEATFFMQNIRSAAGSVNYYDRYGDADYLMSTLANELAYKFFQVEKETDEEKTAKMTSLLLNKQLPVKSVRDLLAGLRDWGVL